MTIVDLEKKNKSNNYLKYIDAFIKLLRFRNSSAVNHHHDIMEVKTWHVNNVRNPRNINA